MKQLKVALPDSLRTLLQDAAEQSDRSLADEIRTRLERSFREDRIDKPTRALLFAIERLAELVALQTGHEWHAHPEANDALLAAISSRFARFRRTDQSVAEPLRPGPLVVSNDPQTLGPALEAMAFRSAVTESGGRMTTEEIEQLDQWLNRMQLEFSSLSSLPSAVMTGPTVSKGVQERSRKPRKTEKL